MDVRTMVLDKRDLYDVLGVARSADAATIKAAYRRQAMALHPDRRGGDATGEAAFKEVTHAYAVLGDAAKRAQYDRRGAGSLDGDGLSMGVALDIFESFMARRAARTGDGRNQVRDGDDLRLAVTVPFDAAVRGETRAVDVPRMGLCPGCEGSGCAAGSRRAMCDRCLGCGRCETEPGSRGVGWRRCEACQGAGDNPERRCPDCGGDGRRLEVATIAVKVPAGVRSGTILRLAGQGHAEPRGRRRGDVHVEITVADGGEFSRDGDDLVYDLPLSIAQVVLGDRITVPTVDGEYRIVVPRGTQPGTILRIPGRGVPWLRGGGRGDQRCVVRVVVPTTLTETQAAVVASLGGRTGWPDRSADATVPARDIFG